MASAHQPLLGVKVAAVEEMPPGLELKGLVPPLLWFRV